MSTPEPQRDGVVPDTKDWTWVLARACPDCGYDAGEVALGDLAGRFRDNAAAWAPLLELPGASARPAPGVWSVTEYAAHVRDVHRVFTGRLEAMLTRADPLFDDWDQDAAAIRGDYAHADLPVVAVELAAAAEQVAAVYAAVRTEQWDRPGRRSNGSSFTIDSLGRYHLHDVVHHLADVTR